MDKKELLKSVLQNYINDKLEDATQDLHQYLTVKSREISGIGNPPSLSQTQSPKVDEPTKVAPVEVKTEEQVTESE